MIVSGLPGNRMRELTFANGAFLLLTVLLLTGLGGCSESPPAPPEVNGPSNGVNIAGEWTGSFKFKSDEEEEQIRVDLTVEKDEATVRYGPSWNCQAKAVFTSANGEEALFRFIKTSSTGGWCDELGDGEMQLKGVGEDLRMHVKGKNPEIEHTVVLHASDG